VGLEIAIRRPPGGRLTGTSTPTPAATEDQGWHRGVFAGQPVLCHRLVYSTAGHGAELLQEAAADAGDSSRSGVEHSLADVPGLVGDSGNAPLAQPVVSRDLPVVANLALAAAAGLLPADIVPPQRAPGGGVLEAASGGSAGAAPSSWRSVAASAGGSHAGSGDRYYVAAGLYHPHPDRPFELRPPPSCALLCRATPGSAEPRAPRPTAGGMDDF